MYLTGSPVVDFDVEPEHAELGSGVVKGVDGVDYLENYFFYNIKNIFKSLVKSDRPAALQMRIRKSGKGRGTHRQLRVLQYSCGQNLFRNATRILPLTSSPRVLNILNSSIVNSSIALTDTTNVEPVAVVFQALEARRGDGLQEINQ